MCTIGTFGQVTAQQIVQSTRTHKSTISRAVNKLVDRGWIERVELEHDRRNLVLQFTQEGQSAYQSIVPKVLKIEQDIISKMGDRADEHLETIRLLEEVLGIADKA